MANLQPNPSLATGLSSLSPSSVREPLNLQAYKHPKDGFSLLPFLVNSYLTILSILLVVVLLGIPYYLVIWRRRIFLQRLHGLLVNLNRNSLPDIYEECIGLQNAMGMAKEIPIFLINEDKVEITYLMQISPRETKADSQGTEYLIALIDWLCCRRFGIFPVMLISCGALQVFQQSRIQFRFLMAHSYAAVALFHPFNVVQNKKMQRNRTLSCDRVAYFFCSGTANSLHEAEEAISRIEVGNHFFKSVNWDAQITSEKQGIHGFSGWVARNLPCYFLGQRIVFLRDFARNLELGL